MTMIARRISLLTALSLVVLLPQLTHAQVRKRDHRKPRTGAPARPAKPHKGVAPIKVTSWGPQQGSVGTEIQLTGTFDRRTSILFGGRTIGKRKVTRTTLTFTVPRRTGDGSIVLRHPDRGSDLVVGTFQVTRPPVVKRFAPRQGVVGSRVELLGDGFQSGDRVVLAGRTAPIVSLAPTRIVITVPAGAATDYFVVTRPGDAESRSRAKFVVTQPAPAITGFNPASGPEGTRVRITGSNFTGADKITFGRRPVPVLGSTATWIDVEVPARARDDYFTVRNSNGQATSASRFAVERPPRVSRFAPLYGPVGTRVEIYGADFAAGDIVTLNNRRLKILQLRSRQISVEIPPGAGGGLIMVERGGLRSGNSIPFEIVSPPRITGFSPTAGAPGTRVTLTGTDFSRDTDVYYGSQKLKLIEWRADQLVVELPRRAGNEYFTVRTRGGEASSAGKFTVQIPSQVTGVSPTAGPIGTRVIFRGRNFATSDRFLLNGLELPMEEYRADRVIVKIPQGAKSGTIGWNTHGQVIRSRFQFTVVAPARVTDIAPRNGPAGTRVVIRGDNFSKDARVYWGAGQRLRVIDHHLPTELTVQIPRRASGTEYLWVDEAGTRVRAPHAFSVVAPPKLASFSPDRGKPGAEVTLTGANFTPSAEVLLGTTPAEVVRRVGNTGLVVRIPPGTPPGRLNFFVQDGGTTVRSRGRFTLLAPAVITRITPTSAKPGDQIDIYGENFGKGSKVYFGAVECRLIRYGRRGEVLSIRLPAGVQGSDYLVVEEDGSRVRSPTKLTITGGNTRPAPPRRGRRGR